MQQCSACIAPFTLQFDVQNVIIIRPNGARHTLWLLCFMHRLPTVGAFRFGRCQLTFALLASGSGSALHTGNHWIDHSTCTRL